MTEIHPLQYDQWQRLAPGFRDYSFRHEWYFSQACAARFGSRSEYIALKEGDSLLGLANVRIKSIPMMGGGVAFINAGPLVRRDDQDDGERLRSCLEALTGEYVRRRGLLLRILSPLGPAAWCDEQAATLHAAGFQPNPNKQSYRTFLLDLEPTPAELRRNLSQKWRNHLKRAETNPTPFTQDNSAAALRDFTALYRAFRQQKGFEADLGPWFFAGVQEQLPVADRFRVVLCRWKGQLIAGHVSSQQGDTAVNLFRANTQMALDRGVAYLLQWNGILQASQRGLRWYDLGGIDPGEKSGVMAFKKGMGGVDLTVPGPFEAYPGTGRRVMIHLCETLYKTLRKR